MRKNVVQQVILHTAQSPDYAALTDKVNELYVSYIERRLRDAGLNTTQKLAVIDGIIGMLHAQEG